MRVLVFGDSIAQGFWDIEGGWVARLRKHYDKKQLEDLNKNEISVFNQGVSADTSHEVVKRIESETIARTRHGVLPTLVVAIGTNDSFVSGGEICVSKEKYKENLEKIVSIAMRVSNQLIFVGLPSCDETKTTPVSWGDFTYTNQHIKQYEDIMSVIATKNNLPFIPIFERFNQEVELGRDLIPDGLHPNEAGHQLICDIVLPELEELLS